MSADMPPLAPSREARQLFNALMPLVDDRMISRANLLALSASRAKKGFRDKEPIQELITEQWVAPTQGGDLKVLL